MADEKKMALQGGGDIQPRRLSYSGAGGSLSPPTRRRYAAQAYRNWVNMGMRGNPPHSAMVDLTLSERVEVETVNQEVKVGNSRKRLRKEQRKLYALKAKRRYLKSGMKLAEKENSVPLFFS